MSSGNSSTWHGKNLFSLSRQTVLCTIQSYESTGKIEINVNEATSAKHLHQMLFDALELPDYFGANWDAFWDVIMSENVLPFQLFMNGWSAK